MHLIFGRLDKALLFSIDACSVTVAYTATDYTLLSLSPHAFG
jgi:hypothetical protein